jgi:hypothetical protein
MVSDSFYLKVIERLVANKLGLNDDEIFSSHSLLSSVITQIYLLLTTSISFLFELFESERLGGTVLSGVFEKLGTPC